MLTSLPVIGFLSDGSHGSIGIVRQSLAAAIRARSEQSVLSFWSNRFLIGELHLGKLSETVVVHGNAPHNRPRFLVSHLIGNRASFLCTKAPMLRVPETNFLHGITSHQLMGEIFRRSSAAATNMASTEFPRQLIHRVHFLDKASRAGILQGPTTTARPINGIRSVLGLRRSHQLVGDAQAAATTEKTTTCH